MCCNKVGDEGVPPAPLATPVPLAEGVASRVPLSARSRSLAGIANFNCLSNHKSN